MRATLAILGLLEVIDDAEYAQIYKDKNTIVYYLLCEAVVNGVVSSVFSGDEYINLGNLAWQMMLEKYEDTFYRKPEAKRIITLLSNHHLDTKTNSIDYRNN